MVMSAIEPKLKAQEAEIAKLANAEKAKKNSGVRIRARLLGLNQVEQQVIQDKEYDKFFGGVVAVPGYARRFYGPIRNPKLAWGLNVWCDPSLPTPSRRKKAGNSLLTHLETGRWWKQHLRVRQQHKHLHQLPGNIRVIVV